LIDSGVVSRVGYQTGGIGPSRAEGRWFVTLFYNYLFSLNFYVVYLIDVKRMKEWSKWINWVIITNENYW